LVSDITRRLLDSTGADIRGDEVGRSYYNLCALLNCYDTDVEDLLLFNTVHSVEEKSSRLP
jgi:hypothetical protein